MLKISLDEGYVFDILSIYQVKLGFLFEEKYTVTENAYKCMSDEIISQIGDEKFQEILQSDEFLNLLESNKNVFQLVDIAQNGEGLAKLVQDGNHDRYICKTKLQQKFFNNNISEIKNR